MIRPVTLGELSLHALMVSKNFGLPSFCTSQEQSRCLLQCRYLLFLKTLYVIRLRGHKSDRLSMTALKKRSEKKSMNDTKKLLAFLGTKIFRIFSYFYTF